MATVKRLNTQTQTQSVNADENMIKVDENGIVTLISLPNLKKQLLDGITTDSLLDGVFILYYKKSDGYPATVKPTAWPSLQSSGEVAAGVVIMEGGKVLVVAPTESTSGLAWNPTNDHLGTTQTSDIMEAITDWSGKENCAQIITNILGMSETSNYAHNFCYNYSRLNPNGVGLAAHKWWLPSAGQMAMIYANLAKINYSLGLISGATPIAGGYYWTSTEAGSSYAWRININSDGLNAWGAKTTGKYKVRPVSELTTNGI